MAIAGRTTKLDDNFSVSAIGFGAGALGRWRSTVTSMTPNRLPRSIAAWTSA